MRQDDGSFDDEIEWTPEERANLAGLSAHRLPPAELKQRTVRALYDRGQLGGRLGGQRRMSTWIVVGGLIAATIVFAAGALFGYAAANRRATPAPAPNVATTNRSVAQLDSASKAAAPTRHVVWY